MKKLLLIIFLGSVGINAFGRPNTATNPTIPVNLADNDRIGSQANGKQVQGIGIVSHILADDNDGSRHQRFILRLKSGQTLLVAHNIDLAPRVDNLRKGDVVQFHGEYEWNAKGGLVHWTHHDPAGRHVAGWLKHNGRVFQ